MADPSKNESLNDRLGEHDGLTERPPEAPTFCVVLLVYNDLPHAERALKSVLAQTDRDFECVVVDNGSTDGSRRILERYTSDDRVRVVRMSRNQRSDAAQAVADATGSRYVSFLFADDFYHPRRLETARKLFEVHSEAGYIFSNCRLVDDRGETVTEVPRSHFVGDISSLDRFGHLYAFLARGNTLHPCAMVVKAEIYRALGGFPTTMHRVGDLAFFTRLLGAYNGVFHGEQMQSIAVWKNGRNESSSNHRQSNQMILERACVLERWLEPGIINNLERIFRFRQTSDLRLDTRAERLWFLAHRMLGFPSPDFQMFGYRLLYEAAADLSAEFEQELARTTGHTISGYVTMLSEHPRIDFALLDGREPGLAVKLLRILPPFLEKEIGKLCCTLGFDNIGSEIYDASISRALSNHLKREEQEMEANALTGPDSPLGHAPYNRWR